MSKWIDKFKKQSLVTASFAGLMTMASAQNSPIKKPDSFAKTIAVNGITKNSLIQNGANDGKYELTLDNDTSEKKPTYEIIISPDDARVAPLVAYAQYLGEAIPKKDSMPEIFFDRIGDDDEAFIKSLPTFAEQREATIAYLLGQAYINGAPINDSVNSMGYGEYDAIASAAMSRLDSLNDKLTEKESELNNITDSVKIALKNQAKEGLTSAENTYHTWEENKKNYIKNALGKDADYNKNTLPKLLKRADRIIFASRMHIAIYKRKLHNGNYLSDYKNDLATSEDRLRQEIAQEYSIGTKELELENSNPGLLTPNDSSFKPLETVFLKTNKRICSVDAAFAAFLMEKAGVGVVFVSGFMTDSIAGTAGHVFCVSKQTLNIIDFTNDFYAKSLTPKTLQQIINGETLVAVNSDSDYLAYGTGYSYSLKSTLSERRQQTSNIYPADYSLDEIKEYDLKLIESIKALDKIKQNPGGKNR